MWNPSTCDCECDKTCEVGEYLDIKNFPCKDRVINDLIWTCEDDILNIAKATLVVDKKVKYENNNCFIPTISLIIMGLLLIITISINCYLYYTKCYLRNKNVLQHY